MTKVADVVVVGAGIVGAAIAQRLATSGRRVVVLERGVPNGEGSGASAANIHVQAIHTRRPGQAVPVDVRRLLPLQVAARERWTAVADELGRDVGFVPTGGLMVADTEAGLLELHTKQEWERDAGLATEVVDGATARSQLPLLGEGVLGATWCADDAYADPALVTPAYLDAAVARGAAVHAGTAVRRLSRRSGTWNIDAGAETWVAPQVVNASGPWLGRVAAMAGIDLRMASVAIQMHRLGPTSDRLPYLVQHVSEGMSVKQDALGRIVLGGGWPARPWTLDQRAEVEPASIEGNIAQVRRVLPRLADLPVESAWPGPLAATPDEMPIAGFLPGVDGLFTVGGTYSFTFAPLWADVTLASLEGSALPVELDGFEPARLVADSSLAPRT